MAAPVKMLLKAIADKVVGVRLLVLALLDVHVEISDITRTPHSCWHKLFSLCFLCGAHRALYCYFDTILYNAPVLYPNQQSEKRTDQMQEAILSFATVKPSGRIRGQSGGIG